MGKYVDEYYDDILELIDSNFNGIYSSVEIELRENDGEYLKITKEMKRILADTPAITDVAEGSSDGVAALSIDDAKALTAYIRLASRRDMIQSRAMYYRGHKDNYAYLKRLGAV